MTSTTYEATLAHLKEHDQGHLLRFYSTLPEQEQKSLLQQISEIDIPRVNRIFQSAIKSEQDEKAKSHEHSDEKSIKPLPKSATASVLDQDSSEKSGEWYQIGLDAVKEGKVAVILMAGGQGTRLGSSAPKGCYDINLPSHKTLFRMQGERIKKLNTLAGAQKGIPWYVMTSGPTRKATESYFKESKYFGLSEENVIFFDQGVLPALTDDGKIFLQDQSTIAVAPDGNGGLYAALRKPLANLPQKQSVLQHMKSRGVEYIHAYCVDNCLVRVADPVFLGYSIQKKAECGAKVVRKSHAKESVGVLAVKDGKYNVVEYSELSEREAELIDETTGELAFRAANIANHYYTLSFLEKVEEIEQSMAFHIARKKIAHVSIESGELVKPSKPNGMKLELFVFDVFPFTQELAVLEVDRKEEFSPLKNAPGTGSDDPETSRRDILAQHARWLKNAGIEINEGAEVELAPAVTYGGEGLAMWKGKKITKSAIFEDAKDVDAATE